MSQINDLHADTKLVTFKQIEWKEMDDKTIGYIPTFEEVLFRKENKIKIIEAESQAMADNRFPPYIILAPISYLEPEPTDLTYPIPFFESKIYFIKQITEVICLESK